MIVEDVSRLKHQMACVQFIAEVSLIANCKPSDLKLALSLIADLTHNEGEERAESIFYRAD